MIAVVRIERLNNSVTQRAIALAVCLILIPKIVSVFGEDGYEFMQTIKITGIYGFPSSIDGYIHSAGKIQHYIIESVDSIYM